MNKTSSAIRVCLLLATASAGCMVVPHPPENQQQPAATQPAQQTATASATTTQPVESAKPEPVKVRVPRMGGGTATDAGAN